MSNSLGGTGLHLGWQQSGRRAGLSKDRHSYFPLHKISNATDREASGTMPTKAVANDEKKFKMPALEDEDDITLPPESSDAEDDPTNDPANMVQTAWTTAAEPKPEIVPSKLRPPPNATRGRRPGRNPTQVTIRPPMKKSSPTSSQASSTSSDNSKRKSQEDAAEIGAGHKQAVGFTGESKTKRLKTKATYTFNQKKKTTSQPNRLQGSTTAEVSKPLGEIPPFQKPNDSSDEEDFLMLPEKTAAVADKLSKPAQTTKTFIAIPMDGDSEDEPNVLPPKPYIPPQLDISPQKPGLKILQSCIKLPSSDDSPRKSELDASKFSRLNSFQDEFASYTLRDTDRPIRDKKALLDRFGFGAVAGLVIEDNASTHGCPTFNEDFPTTKKLSNCPMCSKPVDLDTLKARGQMNTRQQEAFCQSHQKKTAQSAWDAFGYPEIGWENLDYRISKHRSFIEQLVNGKDCHYRQLLDEAVKTGKDRNLLKSTSNITPGYYGSRGLRVISESIMHTFTRLLKKRAVGDKLMSARGVTGFVQSVLVPEVTVMLIMEDMNVDKERARNILKESVGMGELIHEEIRDVVVRHVEESDDSDYD